MKTSKKEKTFDTVKTFRKIKEKIAQDLLGMNFEQIKTYLRENSYKLQQS
jgi:hypothetical protein